MRKFISLVMAAAVTASLVPSTAFAASDEVRGSVQVTNAWDRRAGKTNFNGDVTVGDLPSVKILVSGVSYRAGGGDEDPIARVSLLLNNADFSGFDIAKHVHVRDKNGRTLTYGGGSGQGTEVDATVYGASLSGADESAAIEAVLMDGAEDYYFVTKDKAGKTIAGNPSGTKITADAVKGIAGYDDFVETKETAALADADNFKTELGMGADTTPSADYVWDSDKSAFVKSDASVDGPESFTVADVEAQSGEKYADVLDVDAFVAGEGYKGLKGANVLVKVTAGKITESATISDSGRVGVTGCSVSPSAKVDELDIEFTGRFQKDDVIYIDLPSVMNSASKKATVEVSSRDMSLTNSEKELTYVNIVKDGIKMSVKKMVDVAPEEVVTLNNRGLKIEATADCFQAGDVVTLKLSKGFRFVDRSIGGVDWRVVAENDGKTVAAADVAAIDDDEWEVRVKEDTDEITIYGIEIEADTAKVGATATIKATAKGYGTADVTVAKVVDLLVEVTVEKNEDVPVIYSGVNVDNYGITDDSDHWSLEVTVGETFPGAWSFRKGFNLELPEGVYVADVEVTDVDGFLRTDSQGTTSVRDGEVFKAFFDAYQKGAHKNFEFVKRLFDDVDSTLNEDKAYMSFRLQLVADPGFEGDVTLKLTGEMLDEQEATIAKFVKPYEVKAEQNDLIIDYRYTEVPTSIQISETEGGLWARNTAEFRFDLEKSELMSFENDPAFVTNNDMEVKNEGVKNGVIRFTVGAESDEAATVEIKDVELFMNRNIPAGPYELSLQSSLADAYEAQLLFAPDHQTCEENGTLNKLEKDAYVEDHSKTGKDCFVGEVCDYSETVHESFVNVVTPGREKDDSTFTAKVVVPVGKDYIVAGDKQIKLDAPAYINKGGYTMLPIRAVAIAIGVDNNNVLWDPASKTVTILYGQRIISMTQDKNIVVVNGSRVPASAAVENQNSRTFLPMRDLATALGVTDITWDSATKTATLNGGQE